MINNARFAFFDFDMSSQKSVFSLALASEAIALDNFGSIAPKLHTYSTFFLLKFIFHKKLQVVVGYRFLVLFSINAPRVSIPLGPY